MPVNSTYLQYGGDLMIFLAPTSGGTLQPAAFATSAKLTINLSVREVTSKDSGDWTDNLGGKFAWTMSSDHLLNFSSTGTTLSTDEIYAYFLAKIPVSVAFASKSGTSPSWTVGSGTGKKKFTGQALITSMDVTAANNESATYTINLEGTGALAIA